MNEQHNKTECVVCGEPMPGATGSAWANCDKCGGVVCPTCIGKMRMHYTKYGVGQGFIKVCPNCSGQLENNGNKAINPNQFLGGY